MSFAETQKQQFDLFLKGIPVTSMVYIGTNPVLAEAAYDSIHKKMETGELIPFVGRDLGIRVTDVAMLHKKDPMLGCSVFRVSQEGVLV